MISRISLLLASLMIFALSGRSDGQVLSSTTGLSPVDELAIATASLRHVRDHFGWQRMSLDPRVRQFETRGPGRWSYRLPDFVLGALRERASVDVRRVADVFRCSGTGQERACQMIDADGAVALGAIRRDTESTVTIEINTWYPVRSQVHSSGFHDFWLTLERCDGADGWCVVGMLGHRIS